MSAAEAGREDGWLDDRPDPLWARPAVGDWTRFRVLGLEVVVATNAPRLGRIAAEAFGPALPGRADGAGTGGPPIGPRGGGRDGAGQARDGPAGAPADLRLRLIQGPPAGGDGWPPAGIATDLGRSVLREDGPHFAATDGAGGLVVADLREGAATAWVPAGASADRVRRVLVESPVWRLATWRGLLAVHAAAIVIDGVAVLVRGASGAGKSSVALAADFAGHAVLAEEVAWLDPVRWATWPIARGAYLAGDAALRRAIGERVDERSRPYRLDDDIGKLAVPLLTPPPDGPVALGPLVLLDRSDAALTNMPSASAARAAWAPLPTSAARAAIERDRIVGEHAQPAARWDDVCARLCEGGAFALRGGDPRSRAAALAPLVAEWRRARADDARSRRQVTT